MSTASNVFLRRAVIVGNSLFILWILFNGMDEGWKAKPRQIATYIVLIALLLASSYLIAKSRTRA